MASPVPARRAGQESNQPYRQKPLPRPPIPDSWIDPLQAEGKHIRAGCDREKLLTVHAVGNRARGDEISGFEVPERLSALGIEHRDLSERLRREYDPACSG